MSTELRFRANIDAARAAGNTTDLITTQLIYADFLEDHQREEEAAEVRKEAEAIERLVAAGEMIQDRDENEDGSPIRTVVKMRRTSDWPLASLIPGLSPHQAEQLQKATPRPLGLLIGTPGTGKTRSLSALGIYLCQHYGPNDVVFAAPTGKAGVRMRQAMEDYCKENNIDIEIPTPRTIHSLLGIGRNGHDGNGWGFAYGAGQHLPQRFIVIDEASMLSASLAADLLSACSAKSNVLLIGDTGQLPPIGHGSPLRDMIHAGVPTGELTEIHRNAGMIVRACVSIRNSEPFETAERFDREAGMNLRHLEVGKSENILPMLKQLLSGWRASRRWNPLADVQVVCAMNEKGDLSRDRLNRELQDLLNPLPPLDEGSVAEEPATWRINGRRLSEQQRADRALKYRPNDKIICLRNGWYQREDDITETEYVANGEQGVVVSADPSRTTAAFGDRVVIVRSHEAGDFDLGWAVTCHKMQGSSAPVVIALIDRQANRVCNREWWYTAISRASELCVTIGRKELMAMQAKKPALARRKTFLTELIEEQMKYVL